MDDLDKYIEEREEKQPGLKDVIKARERGVPGVAPLIWFTSDWHVSHFNIISYANRPFSSVREMNRVIIENCNALVREKDILFFLGDISMKKRVVEKTLDKINCKQIHFIYGNHDKPARKIIAAHKKVVWAGDLKSVPIQTSAGKIHVALCHYPMLSWDKKAHGSIMLHGHCHAAIPDRPKSLDVGVDAWNFKPANIEQVLERLNNVKKEDPI